MGNNGVLFSNTRTPHISFLVKRFQHFKTIFCCFHLLNYLKFATSEKILGKTNPLIKQSFLVLFSNKFSSQHFKTVFCCFRLFKFASSEKKKYREKLPPPPQINYYFFIFLCWYLPGLKFGIVMGKQMFRINIVNLDLKIQSEQRAFMLDPCS